MTKAVETTRQIFEKTFTYAQTGLSESQVSEFMHRQLVEFNVQPAWDYDNCPTVNSGPDSPVGHVGPTEIRLQRGHILHIDFGVLAGRILLRHPARGLFPQTR